VVLAAKDKVNVINTTDTDSTRSSNSSGGSSIGVQYTLGGGFGVSAAMANAHGDANSDASMQNASHVTGANSVTVISGGDTNIIGSQITGKQVSADVGGNLNIASVQDTMTSAAHQDSKGGGFAISTGGGSASYSSTHGNADGSYAGVTEQSGIHAGTDGFDINVHGNTGLKGAVIASDADASKNALTTGTLTFSDIQNHSEYSANSVGVSVGGGSGNGGNNYATTGPTSGKNTGGVLPTFASDSDSSSASTQSAISAGTITITDTVNQTQDVASLSRDTSNTNGTVNKTPDLNNLLDKQADLMSAISAASEAVSRRIGDYADSQKQAAESAGDQAGVDAWAEGGAYRAEMQAAGAALVGGLGGGVGSAAGSAAGAGLASMCAGKLNELSDSIANSSPTGNADIDRTLGKIVANVIATGAGTAVGGGAGATSAANVDRYNRHLHPDEYAMAKKDAKVVAQKLGISEEAAEGRIVAEILRNSDQQTADAAGGTHDYEVRSIVGCQNLNCNGYKTDPQYANHDYNSQYIAGNQSAYNAGQSQIGTGQTYNDLVKSNIKNDPVGATLAGVGMIGLGVVTAGGVPTLAGMAMGGSIGAGVNSGAQYVFNNGQINFADVAMAGATGALTFGTGLLPGLLINTGGAWQDRQLRAITRMSIWPGQPLAP